MAALPTIAQVPAFKLGVLSLVSAAGAFVLPVPWNSGSVALVLCGLLTIAILLLWRRQIVLCYAVAIVGIGVFLVSAWRWALPPMTDAVVQPFPAYIEGRIVDILRVQPQRLRCIVEGQVDAQSLPPIQARTLLSITGVRGTEPWAQPGRTIRATIRLRPPRLATLPTDFPEWDYCAHLDVQWMGFARASDVSLWEEQSRSHIDLLEFLAHQRQRLREWIAELYPSDIRPLALALLVGDRSELAPQQRREFALTGAAHVLAISGLHVGVVAGIVFIVLGFLPYRWLRWLCASLLIVLFVGLTGAQPSALRAAGMAILGSALYLLQRQPHPVNVVAAVAFGLLLLQPELLFSRSFQLSVLATLGIVGLFGPFAQWLQQLAPALPQFLRDMVALTLAATCGSASVAALAFGIFSLLSIPINVAAVPMSGAALIAGLLGMLFHGAVPPVGELYTSAAIACLRGLTWLTHHAAQLPFAALEGHSAAVAAVGVSAGLLWLLKAQRWLHVLPRFCVVVAGIALGSYWLRPSIQPQLAPRERLVAAFLPTAPDTTVVVLIDRLPRHKPKRDPALEDYLRILSGHLSIAYTGYTSELLALQCFRSRPNVSVLPAPPAIVDYIHQLFRSPQPLRQLYRPLLLPANSERLK